MKRHIGTILLLTLVVNAIARWLVWQVGRRAEGLSR